MRAGDVVSLRVRTPDGPTDVVGTLVAASPAAVVVRRRDGSVVEIPVDDVEAGRVVPPGPARTVAVHDLQLVMADGWRALETEWIGPWLARAAGGFTGRANSALVSNDAVDLPAILDRVERWYAARGLPPRLQVAADEQPPGLADLLAQRGWQTSPPTHVMTAEIAHVLRGSDSTTAAVAVEEQPDAQWLRLYRSQEGPLPDVAGALLANHPRVRFASIHDDGQCVAIARVVVDGRWAGVFGVEVAAEQRRRGRGATVVAAALRWATGQGARRTYLQVFAPNTGGVAFWHRLGYAVHHDYVYRAPA